MPAESRSAREAERADRASRITGITGLGREEAPPRSTPDRKLHPLDEELLERLERRFALIAGADRKICVAELGKALEIRSEALAKRVLAAFDRDRDGDVDVDDFLGSLQRLLLGSVRDRLLFAFRVHDVDGDGALDRTELESLIGLGLSEASVASPPGEASRLAALVLRGADVNRDGRVSFAEFEAAIGRNPEVARHVTTSGACWVSPNEDALDRRGQAPPFGVRAARYLQNHATSIAVIGLWVAANAVLFERARSAYAASGANGFIQIARGSAACVNLNAAVVLLPMMRRLLTWLQAKGPSRVLRLGEAVDFHRLLGEAMFGFAALHTAAHLGNYYSRNPASPFAGFTAVPANVSGVAWLGVFAIMWLLARKGLRRRHFNAFYYSHLLYFAWFAVGVVHARSFAFWTALPLAGFAVERIVRHVTRVRSADIVEMRALRSGVTRLSLRKPEGFRARAGDFVFLQVPSLVPHEWHPFTISSAPEKDELTLHVRALGDFSSGLRELAESRHAKSDDSEVTAYLDGPYGAPCTDVMSSRRAVLVAGGIGVTPFASILESIVLRSRGARERGAPPDGAPASHPLMRVDFFWLNRDQYSFEWFTDLLGRLAAIDERGMVHAHVYMTGGRSDAASALLNLAAGMMHDAGQPDLVTGLRIQTHMGHPAWAEELERIAAEAGDVPVDVYFCGPEGLGKKLERICDRLGMDFRREPF